MRIFEVDNGKFVNMDNVFKFELMNKKDNKMLFWRFLSNADNSVDGKEFGDSFEAITWLNMTLARAEGAGEIITL
ncbi:MAG: hypothetical protein Q7J16_08580 [Candidatus Cloacimonadales bacterium]|nr:hypothetical protein [Candidatus Cloacimonadales bacterium]